MSKQQQINVILKVLGDIGDLKSKITGIEQVFKNLKLPPTLENSFRNVFTSLEGNLNKFEGQLQKGFKTKGALSNLEATSKAIIHDFDKLSGVITKVKGLDLQEIVKFPPEVNQKIKSLQTKIDNLKNSMSGITSTSSEVASALDKITAKGQLDTKSFIQAKINAGEYSEALKKVEEALINQQNASKRVGDGSKAKATIENQIAGYSQLQKILTQQKIIIKKK